MSRRQDHARSVHDVLVATARQWLVDPDSDVVWTGEHEGRFGVRLRQQVRDFTTVWFDVGEITLGCEAYVVPPPHHDREEVYRQCLARNASTWRVHLALDRDGAVVIRGRMPLESVTPESLDALLGAIYDLVEVSFRPLLRAGFLRREKTP